MPRMNATATASWNGRGRRRGAILGIYYLLRWRDSEADESGVCVRVKRVVPRDRAGDVGCVGCSRVFPLGRSKAAAWLCAFRGFDGILKGRDAIKDRAHGLGATWSAVLE